MKLVAFRPRGLQTHWQLQDLLVLRNGREVERLPAGDIRRVILACRHGAPAPQALSWALLEMAQDAVLLPAHSGIAGRVHLEHQGFWSSRDCIYWVDEALAPLPWRLRPGGFGLWGRWRPSYLRLPRAALAPLVARWPLQGPQTWEQRKGEQLMRHRLLAPLDQALDEVRRRQGR